MSATPRATDHLAPLDGLRGIAIALVVWFHVWQITWLAADVKMFGATFNFNWIAEDGFVGVDLFFFISGFCLFYPYARTLFDGTKRQDVATFAYRRAIKIMPSYVFAIAAMIALGWAKFDSPADALRQVGLHLLFVHTWWNDSYGSINGVLWSLATEVQFYAIFPLVAWAAMRRPWLTFAAMAVVANAYRIAFAGDADVVHKIDQLPGTLDLFGAGMLAAYVFRLVATRAPALARRRSVWTALALAGTGAFGALLTTCFDARLFAEWPNKWLLYGRREWRSRSSRSRSARSSPFRSGNAFSRIRSSSFSRRSRTICICGISRSRVPSSPPMFRRSRARANTSIRTGVCPTRFFRSARPSWLQPP